MHTAVLKEPTPCTVTLQGVRQSFPLGAGQHLQVLDIAQLTLALGASHSSEVLVGLVKPHSISRPALPSQTLDHIHVGQYRHCRLIRTTARPRRAAHIGYILQTFNLLAAFTASTTFCWPCCLPTSCLKPAGANAHCPALQAGPQRQAETSPGPIIARRAAACGYCTGPRQPAAAPPG